MKHDPNELLTVGEAAQVLRKSERKVYYYIRRGRLPALKIGNGIRVVRKDAVNFANNVRNLPENDVIPEGAMDLNECARWMKYHPEYVRRLALTKQIPGHKTSVRGRWYFYKDEILEYRAKEAV